MLHLVEVTAPLDIRYEDKHLRIVDDGYIWIQQFPDGARYAVTTMFDATGKVVQTYIDICLRVGADDGRPWWEDLFLDLIVLPSGEIFLRDVEELE
ncbi:DUF402 domain-containing protein [Exiguobacterium flavidum]|uniref:DUF402 domain-containing protein n=1 Tax=Exiguobacterium flavidum TaxID=2184695 RepID=UPI0013005776|nr:DUF402 domain-containing protein [Exiguobacterium flavidum]